MIIITPYYGKIKDSNFTLRKQYLEETIRSIDNQKGVDIFHLIVDDGSGDGLCDELREKYSGNSRSFIRRERHKRDILTCTNAINYGLEKVLGEGDSFSKDIREHQFITFLHSDDLAINLDIRNNKMEEGDLSFLYTDALIFFDYKQEEVLWQGMEGDIGDIKNNFWVLGQMTYPTMTWDREFLKMIKEYNANNYNIDQVLDPTIGCGEDVDIALTSLSLANTTGLKIGYLSEITAKYRIHNNSLAELRDQKKRRSEENSVLQKHFGAKGSLLLHLRRIIKRPECYFPSLFSYRLKNNFKKLR